MIAIDTNILVYAHRRDSPWFVQAQKCLETASEGSAPWAIPWPCIHEFLSVTTNARIYRPPSQPREAIEQIEIWMESPTVRLLGEASGYWQDLSRAILAGQIVGAAVHDARIAAICQAHGIREFWSADRDFGRFPTLKVRNPLIE